MIVPPVGAAAATTGPIAPARVAAPAGEGFGDQLAGALDDLQATHADADRLAVQAATGDLQDVHDFMIASTRAALATELTVAVRNRAVEAFTSIMQMGI